MVWACAAKRRQWLGEEMYVVKDDSEISKPDSIRFDFLKKISISNYERFLQSTPVPPSD